MERLAVHWDRQSILAAIHRRSLWMEILGGALIVLGFFALIAVEVASIASVYLIGGILLAAGAANIAATVAFWRSRSGGFVLGILLGVLCGIAGILCITRPAGSLAAITFFLGSYFIATGIARLAVELYHRLPGWGWGMAVAALEVFLGIVILAWWPVSSIVVPGTLLGIQLIASGVAAVTTGGAVRNLLALRPESEEPPPRRPATRFQH